MSCTELLTLAPELLTDVSLILTSESVGLSIQIVWSSPPSENPIPIPFGLNSTPGNVTFLFPIPIMGGGANGLGLCCGGMDCWRLDGEN